MHATTSGRPWASASRPLPCQSVPLAPPHGCVFAARVQRRAPGPAAAARAAVAPQEVPWLDKQLDDKLSMRPLELDPAGYFIIKVDRAAKELVVDFYSNNINAKGLAVDDETGEVIGCKPGGAARLPRRVYRGRTAKETCVALLEGPRAAAAPCTRLEHACYLGRELARAEFALITGDEYVQD